MQIYVNITLVFADYSPEVVILSSVKCINDGSNINVTFFGESYKFLNVKLHLTLMFNAI